jgi:hypothetical protein
VETAERSLRYLVRAIRGDDWSADLTPEQIKRITQYREGEVARRVGVSLSSDLLEYTSLEHLADVIGRRWEDFKDVIGDQQTFFVNVKRFKGLRDPTSHIRPLVPYERELLSGIAGEWQNLAAKHRSAMGPDREWYPVIESIMDSFGRGVTPLLNIPSTATDPVRLQVGDVVTFECKAHDPQDRELTWVMFIGKSTGLPAVPPTTMTGSSVTFTWKVGKEHVGENVYILLQMRSSGPYYREGEYDGVTRLNYAVSVPR